MKIKITAAFILFILFLGTLSLAPPAVYGQKLDGIIHENEYPNFFSSGDGNYSLFWKIKGDSINIGISAKTTGYVAIGFGPTQAMQDADIVFGLVDERGRASALDTFSIGPYGPHPPDAELGGTNDILEYTVSETDGKTVFEFSRMLNTGDRFDKNIDPEKGTKIIWAYGESDDYNDIHAARGSGTLLSEGTELTREGLGLLLIIHIILMSVSFILMITGMFLPRYFKKKKWWLNAHKTLGITGASLGSIAVGTAFLMVAVLSGVHFRVIHSFFGFVTIACIIATPFLGQSIFWAKREYKKTFRILHRWWGRSVLILMAATIVLGLIVAGIL